MKLARVAEVPPGISFDPEMTLLRRISRLAERANFKRVPKSSQDEETRRYTDLVLEGPAGRLLFAVRPKPTNDHARIDVDSRPKTHFRTRHVRLERRDDGAWRVVTDSEIPLGYELDEAGMHSFVEQMLAP